MPIETIKRIDEYGYRVLPAKDAVEIGERVLGRIKEQGLDSFSQQCRNEFSLDRDDITKIDQVEHKFLPTIPKDILTSEYLHIDRCLILPDTYSSPKLVNNISRDYRMLVNLSISLAVIGFCAEQTRDINACQGSEQPAIETPAITELFYLESGEAVLIDNICPPEQQIPYILRGEVFLALQATG